MKNLKIIQVNLNGQLIASEQLRDRCVREKLDIILAQEPPINGNGLVANFESCLQVSNFDNPGATIIVTKIGCGQE